MGRPGTRKAERDERIHGSSTPGRQRSDPALARRSGQRAARAQRPEPGARPSHLVVDRHDLRAVPAGAGPGALTRTSRNNATSDARANPMIGPMARRISSPVIVGRDDELALLRATVERGREGEAETVLIGGEAGVGKSRLIGQLVAEAQPVGARVIGGGRAGLV